MIVKLNGKNGRLDIIEKDVESVVINGYRIEISYKKPYKWGIICGVVYDADEYEFASCERK